MKDPEYGAQPDTDKLHPAAQNQQTLDRRVDHNIRGDGKTRLKPTKFSIYLKLKNKKEECPDRVVKVPLSLVRIGAAESVETAAIHPMDWFEVVALYTRLPQVS